jgi:hypothetical protein
VQLLGNGLVGTNVHCSICDFVVPKKMQILKNSASA